MIARLWTTFLLLLAGGFAVAWLVALLRERNVRPARSLTDFFRNQSKLGRVVLGAFFVGMWIYASTKPGGGGSGGTGGDGGGTNGVQMVQGIVAGGGGLTQSRRDAENGRGQGFRGGSAQLSGGEGGGDSHTEDMWADFEPITSEHTDQVLDADDFRRGFVMTRVGTDEAFDFAPASDAVVNADWQAFGAAEDWFYLALEDWAFRLGTNAVDRLRIFSFGRVEPMPPATNRWFAPFLASLGIVPNSEQVTVNSEQGTENASQPLNPSTPQPSQFWHLVTPSNTLQLTWQNVLLDRAADRPVSFQMELWPSGRLIYRFDLSRLDVDEVTNVLVGASLDGLAWTTNALPTNVTSLVFHPLTPEDAENQDRDGDGLTLLDELFVHHTDPDLWDTDGDGVSDGDEVAVRTHPCVRDSDGDGFADGTDPRPASPDLWTDSDGDGLPDEWKTDWFGTNSVSSYADANGDGVSNLAALLTGVNPTNAPSAGFRSDCGAASSRMVAWEVARTGFSFTRPAGLTNLVSRTFRVDRESPWQQLFVSSRPNAAAGWFASDVRIRYGLDDGPVTNLVPAASTDSWRLPLGPDAVTNVVFVVEAVGDAPALSHPLHLIRWSPRVGIPSDESGSFMSMPAGKAPVFMSSRRAESGWYVVPFAVDCSDMPHAGSDAELDAQLALPPVRDVAVTNVPTRALLSPDPVWVELPPEGTNASVRLCCWEIRTTADGEIASGPRSSQYDSPYPLSSPELRLGFHRAEKLRSSGTVTMTIYPEHPLVGLFPPRWPRSAPQNPVRLMTGSPSTTNEPPWNPITGDPPFGGTPGIDGESFDDGYTPIDPASDETKGETTEEDDNDGCGDPDECPCGGEGDGSKQCSFRLRVSLGSSVPGEPSGFLWTALEQPTCVTTTVFNVLAAPGVSATTNAVGEFTVVNPSPGGRAVSVTNMPHGVAVSVWNASGRFEARWEVTNPEGDFNYVRCRKITVLGNATSDELFCLDDGMTGSGWELPEDARVSGLDPSDQVVREDAIHGVRNVKRKWRTDPEEPEFVTDVFDEVFLGNERVSAVMSEFAKFGEGATARRRLVRRYGFDEQGELDETRDYWNDAGSRRHARLRSIRSNRQAWSFHDYDERGRETVLLEQLDGSPFPDGLAFGGSAGDAAARGLAALPTGCSAKATVTSYAPATGDSDDRNDVDQPRRRDVYVLRAGRDPVLIGTETWLYTRSTDSAGVPLRTCVHSTGIGSTLRSETTVEYPEGDYAVPKELRGRAVSSLDFDGVLATHVLERGTWDPATRTFTASPSGDFLRTTTRRSRDGVSAKTYTVTVENALRRLIVYRAELLTADDATIDWSASSYDDVDRLRSTVYPDGTFETNAYSCCRLLWRQDRQGRKVLRSARTGTDDLYYAEEDVWCVDTNGAHRVTQHFFDGLGRETNTVTYLAVDAGVACDPITPDESQQPASLGLKTHDVLEDWELGPASRTESVDSRGRRDVTCSAQCEECAVTRTETDDAEAWSEWSVTRTTSYRNGATVSERDPWGGSDWTCRVRCTDWDADGLRFDVDWTDSNDYGVVTNSVIRYDALGRADSIWTPLGETVNEYDGASTRLLASTTTSSGGIVRVTLYLHDEMGERIGTVVDGVTNRTDIGYELRDGLHWRVATKTETGPETNAVSVVRERLDGLSDVLRGCTVAVGADGVVATNTVSCDSATGIETSVTTSSVGTPVVRRSRCELVLEAETAEETTVSTYDAFGRVVKVERGKHADSALQPVLDNFYDAVGDLVSKATYTNGTDAVVEDYAYDFKGRRVLSVNALGNETATEYDAWDRVVHVSGATYPVWYEYDSQDRRVALYTIRDEESWQQDATRWTFDGATGLCTRKTYADGSHVDYTYTGDGKLLRTTYPGGKWKECVYDSRRRLCGMEYSSRDMAYDLQLDAYGNVTNAVDAAGNAWSYIYGANSVLLGETAETAGREDVLTRHVDAFQRPTGYSLAVDGVARGGVGYAYDAENRIRGIAATNAAGRSFSVAYTNDAGYNYGYAITTPNGGVIRRVVERDPFRRGLVTNCSTYHGDTLVDAYAYTYDAGGRPVSRNADAFGYDARDQVTFAAIGTNVYTHAYDGIGNHVLSGVNSVTNLMENNQLNQLKRIVSADGSTTNAVSWNVHGGMARDDLWTYTYDAEDQLIAVTARSRTNGAIRVRSAYDCRHRRIAKIVERLAVTQAPPPAIPVTLERWDLVERRDFVWDDWNIIHEFVTAVDGVSTNVTEIQYFWGLDLSDSLQGAGGVGGLLAVSRNGSFYFPVYDNNGNVMKYVDESGTVAAAYVYDDFGKIVSQTGSLADAFSFRFSTKYFDRKMGMIAYQLRCYKPDERVWINRDPEEESGGYNLYAFLDNEPLAFIDHLGTRVVVVLGGATSDKRAFEVVKNDIQRAVRASREASKTLNGISQEEYDCWQRQRKVRFGGVVFTGKFSEYKFKVNRESSSSAREEEEYKNALKYLTFVSATLTESYDILVFAAHGEAGWANPKTTAIYFSGGAVDQKKVRSAVLSSMKNTKAQKEFVSCHQTWNGVGKRSSATQEFLRVVAPKLDRSNGLDFIPTKIRHWIGGTK